MEGEYGGYLAPIIPNEPPTDTQVFIRILQYRSMMVMSLILSIYNLLVVYFAHL